MAEDEGRTEDEGTEDETEDEGTEEESEGTEEESGEDDPAALRKDRDSAIKRRDKALARARAAEKELAALRAAKDGKESEEPDPVEEAHAKLVRSSARTALTAAGVSKDDQADVLDLLNLSGVTVDARGDVDEDAVEDAVEVLRRAFGGTSNGRRTRPRTDPRDRGSAGGKSDPDSERYARIIGGRGRR